MRRNKTRYRWILPAFCAAATVLLPAPTASAGRAMKQYRTRYYVIHSDLGKDEVREAAVRMTAMAEEYYQRTKGFTGVIRKRMPFYLYSNEADYHRDGGLPESSGLYTGRRLMAVAGGRPDAWTWQVIQHEGFHQFVDVVIGGRIPVWVNEGLAEYFGQALFTGDGFVSGIIPPGRLRAVQAAIRDGKFKSCEAMMQLSYDDWKDQMSSGNYDQAWSMVHFLAHAHGGKYQKAFERFLKAVGRKREWKDAWKQRFGADVAAFQKRWSEWWQAQPPNPTDDLYVKAVAATMTSYLARSASQGQRFKTWREFLAAADAGQLKGHAKDWLPPRLLAENLPRAGLLATWTIVQERARLPRLRCEARSGTVLVGRFTLKGDRVEKVWVQRQSPASQPAEDEPPRPAPAR